MRGRLITPLAKCAAIVIAAHLAFGAGVSAQAPRTTALKPPNGSLGDGFTNVIGVRELSDGTVLIADWYERRLVVADYRSGETREIGRKGQGPGEFSGINGLFALGGDSTLVEDRFAQRWIILDGSRPAVTVSSVIPGEKTPAVYGADQSGRILDIRIYSPDAARIGMREYAESLLVFVRQRARGGAAGGPTRLTSRLDTLVRLHGRGRAVTMAKRPVVRGGQPIPWELKNPLAVDDQALLLSDGWIAIAFADPYRVDWITPAGAHVRGQPITLDRILVDERIKRGLIAREYPKAQPPFEPNDFPPWPDVLPGFQTRALLSAPDGRLVIRRTFNPLEPATTYDIVDRKGFVAGRLELKPNQRLVGFGATSAYVVEKDGDDVEWVNRYPWP